MTKPPVSDFELVKKIPEVCFATSDTQPESIKKSTLKQTTLQLFRSSNLGELISSIRSLCHKPNV